MQVVQAYKLVKANAGAAGVDKETLDDFEQKRKDNLYKLWNRMSSGSYTPPAVRAVAIPKKTGSERILGVPTVSDRIAQMVVKLEFEPEVEPHFLTDSYGYRPNKSALDTIAVTKSRCWQYDWVIEFDIKGLFDNISHELLMKAVHKHTTNKWVILYIERWLKAPMQQEDGTIINRICGVPQGGVISPILSNLFLHYVFDKWMQRHYPGTLWCRYADDGVIHCKTKAQAEALLSALKQRFNACELDLHPDKTKIIYCKDKKRRNKHTETSFDFLGFTFRPRLVVNRKQGGLFMGYTPAVSKSAQKSMRAKIKSFRLYKRSELSLEEIAIKFNPTLRGWLNYYGKFNPWEMESVWRYFNKTLVAWLMRKCKRFHQHKTKAAKYLKGIADKQRSLFVHWYIGMQGPFA
ncbi:MAG: group II intron reverse transcriptase/maturase [Legionella sp.]|nr:group II intron reverse transcriptase/maturase [Legionella sp.]